MYRKGIKNCEYYFDNLLESETHTAYWWYTLKQGRCRSARYNTGGPYSRSKALYLNPRYAQLAKFCMPSEELGLSRAFRNTRTCTVPPALTQQWMLTFPELYRSHRWNGLLITTGHHLAPCLSLTFFFSLSFSLLVISSKRGPESQWVGHLPKLELNIFGQW